MKHKDDFGLPARYRDYASLDQEMEPIGFGTQMMGGEASKLWWVATEAGIGLRFIETNANS